jgi:hypothetical protein
MGLRAFDLKCLRVEDVPAFREIDPGAVPSVEANRDRPANARFEALLANRHRKE